MNNYYYNAIKNIEIFFREDIKCYKDIFAILNKIFKNSNGAIYFVSSENLRLEYSQVENSFLENIKLDSDTHKNIFSIEEKINTKLLDKNKNVLAERLIIHNTIFGIILIERNEAFIAEEKEFFKTCSMIISSIIKELELTKVLKLQAEELQKGIIETVKANEIIKSQNKKIVAADKVKTEFFSHVSHELRTPLNSIIGFSELLQNPKLGKLNTKQLEFIKDIQTAGINLLGMINEVLDISKIESGSIKLNLMTFDIQLCINETLNILKPLYEKKKIKLINNSTSTIITADYQKIQQVLFNIINNAIKFSPENETIEIATSNTNKHLEISIKDNGCGIATKNHKKIFKKFEQIETTQNSTGLGLAISKEIIKLHKGKINLNSELNQGAEFIIKLPLSYV